jgi:RHS repeat-associated protein
MRVLAWTILTGSALFLAGFSPESLSKSPPPGSSAKETAKAGLGLEWRFERDADGRIIRVVDPAGRPTRLHYELEKKQVRRLTREGPDGTKVVLEFDRFGRRTSMSDAAGKVHYEYDASHRLRTVRRGKGPALEYDYDTVGRISSLKLGKDFSVAYGYDFLGRLAKITTPAGDISYEYQTGSNRIVRRYPSGMWSAWQYHASGKLESITHVDGDNKVRVKLTYDYRPDGLIASFKEWTAGGNRTVGYDYDKVQRLIAVDDSRYGKTTYRYDKFGNRIEIKSGEEAATVSAHDWADRLLTHNGQKCVHDAAGNLTEYQAAAGTAVLSYTPENLLQTAEVNGVKLQYEYDGEGNLLARRAGDKTMSFVPDPRSGIWRPLLATDADGKRTFYLWEGNIPLAALSDGKVQFFLHDHLGTVGHQGNEKGEISALPACDPFGVPQGLDVFAGSEFRPGFAGMFYDPEAGLYLTRARAYDPQLGRFLQLDPQHRIPFGSQKDLSAYAYCGGDPVNFVDRNGAEPGGFTSWIGADAGEEAAQGWADEYVKTGNPLYAFLGTAAALWTPDNWWKTALTFAGGTVAGRLAAGVGPTVGEAWTATSEFASNAVDKVGKFFYDARPYRVVSREYWAENGPAAGRSLHHWLFPQRATWVPEGLRNAGFNLLELPANPTIKGFNLNSWMGFAPSWTNYPAHQVGAWLLENGIRVGIPSALAGSAALGGYLGSGGHLYYDESMPKSKAGSNLGPTNIGGISLRGAGKALEHLGPLAGIALGPNGKLILIAHDKGNLDLPPLRLDDVVTIFRSVYEHGEGPFVSIDPDPKDSRGPTMNVRHGPGTANTYVGWVLFEADRVMKTFRQGADNVTRLPIKTSIAGYEEMMELQYVLRSDKEREESKKEDRWNRYWIVPASVERLQTKSRQLTLLDVPLQAETEAMNLVDGKLVSGNRPSSKEALAFAKWFTQHYGDLEKEWRSPPPRGSGLKGDVPVFTELRRIAFISALAESLRDQGVPMPAWMKDYPVRPFPVPQTTPTLRFEVKHKVNGQNYTFSFFGGVTLSPPRSNIQTVKESEKAEKLAHDLQPAVKDARLLTPIPFNSGGQKYQAVVLPGNDTQAVGAGQLAEADLVVPLGHDKQISLNRFAHSFYQPRDVFGEGWTLNLPHLSKQLMATSRVQKGKNHHSTHKWVYQLTSPLNTWAETFLEEKHVPEANGKLIVPQKSSDMLGIAYLGEGKNSLRFRDGREWHFDEAGYLIAVVEAPVTLHYQRDKDHRLTKIEGCCGAEKRAAIQLSYDMQGRLDKATGSDGSVVLYGYQENHLAQVKKATQTTAYKYEAGRVSKVWHNGKLHRELTYEEHGQLLSERGADGEKWTYKVKESDKGVEVSSTSAKGKESATYDALFRPVGRTFADGTSLTWKYSEKAAVEMKLALSDGGTCVANRSADGKQTVIRLPNGVSFELSEDPVQGTTSVKQDGRLLVERKWLWTGQLASAKYETVEVFPSYGKDRLLESVFLGGQKQKDGKFAQWRKLTYDKAGRLLESTDFFGGATRLAHNDKGELTSWTNKLGKVEIERDARGRIEKVSTSWGSHQKYEYDPTSGKLQRLEVSRKGKQAVAVLDGDRLTKLRQFDGGELSVSYFDKGPKLGKVREVRTPNDLVLEYDYNAARQLAAINCGGTYRIEYRFDEKSRLAGVKLMPRAK